MKVRTLLGALFIAVVQTACDMSGFVAFRSGSIDDDYVAEPLADAVSQYETALTTSNNIIHMMSKSKYRDIHRIYFSDLMKSQLTERELSKQMASVENYAGPIKDYKEMQWGFFSRTVDGVDLLYSVKIVEHERTFMKYLFIFKRDKPYTNLVGFSMKERDGVLPPGQF